MEDVVTFWSDTVDVVDHPRELAALVGTLLLLHELLEAVLGQLFVLDVVRLVFLCKANPGLYTASSTATELRPSETAVSFRAAEGEKGAWDVTRDRGNGLWDVTGDRTRGVTDNREDIRGDTRNKCYTRHN